MASSNFTAKKNHVPAQFGLHHLRPSLHWQTTLPRPENANARAIREYCKHRGWKFFAGEYVDEGISGTKDSRPPNSTSSRWPMLTRRRVSTR